MMTALVQRSVTWLKRCRLLLAEVREVAAAVDAARDCFEESDDWSSSPQTRPPL